MPPKKLGSARLAISCKKSSVQLGLLYDLKNRVTLKTKNELIFNYFATFLRYNLEDINKSVFFLLKNCILKKNQLKIVKNSSILENRKPGLARFWKQKARLGSARLFWKKLGSARQKVGSDPTLWYSFSETVYIFKKIWTSRQTFWFCYLKSHFFVLHKSSRSMSSHVLFLWHCNWQIFWTTQKLM